MQNGTAKLTREDGYPVIKKIKKKIKKRTPEVSVKKKRTTWNCEDYSEN
jgi:hypothetical protein